MLGSRYYVSHPAFPLNRTVAMFQMDMIGRNEEHPCGTVPAEFRKSKPPTIQMR